MLSKGHLYLALAVVVGMTLYKRVVEGKFADRDLAMGITLANVVEALTIVVAVILVHKALPVSA